MAPPVGNDIFAGRCTCGLVDGDVERYKNVRLKSAVGDITAKDMLNVRQAEIEAGGMGSTTGRSNPVQTRRTGDTGPQP